MTFRSLAWVRVVCLIAAFGVVYGTYLFQATLPVAGFYIGLGIIICLVWLIKRSGVEKVRLPKTGLEFLLLIFFAWVTVSLNLSAAPRSGLERLIWYLAAVILFYFLVDLFDQAERRAELRTAIFAATLFITATILLTAILDTYYRYLGWWDEVGSQTIMPPFQIRLTSLVGGPNLFQALMNLVAPVALMTFLRTRRRSVRFLSSIWLVMYICALPFTSSRGGWLGAVGWAGTLIVVWLLDQERWRVYLLICRKRLGTTISTGAALMAVGGLAALRFYQVFAGSHPSHGSGEYALNREWIWASALQVWEASPWIGSGLARVGLEMLRTTPNYPAKWWAIHAHSVPINFLVETGVFGFLAVLGLTLYTGFLVIKQYQNSVPSEKAWSGTSLAALVGLFLHGIFDNFSQLSYILILLVLHVALILTSSNPIERFKRLPLFALAVPAMSIAAFAIFYLWSYAPYYNVVRQEIIDWKVAAHASAESARRDPTMPFYHGQAGIAYGMAWAENGDPEHLANARQFFERGLALEPNNSVHWVNLAMLRFYAGQTGPAIEAFQQAIELCPTEPSFYVNFGWFYEQIGEEDEALKQYQRALGLNPRLAAHPFWLSSVVREKVIATFSQPMPETRYYWENAQAELARGNFPDARYELALSGLNRESKSARYSLWASLALANGDQEEAVSMLLMMADQIETRYWIGWSNGDLFAYYFARQSFLPVIVPGYIRVTEDFGQFDNLRRLVDLQRSAGECEEAAFTWQVLQRELHAGELVPGGYPPMPACAPVQQAGG